MMMVKVDVELIWDSSQWSGIKTSCAKLEPYVLSIYFKLYLQTHFYQLQYVCFVCETWVHVYTLVCTAGILHIPQLMRFFGYLGSLIWIAQ